MPNRITARRPKIGSYDRITDDTLVELGPAIPNGRAAVSGKPLSRREVFVDGVLAGEIRQVEVHSTAPVKGHRYTRTLGYPVRWTLHVPNVRLKGTHIDAMHSAALRLADEYLHVQAHG